MQAETSQFLLYCGVGRICYATVWLNNMLCINKFIVKRQHLTSTEILKSCQLSFRHGQVY